MRVRRQAGRRFHPKIARLEKTEGSHVSLCQQHLQMRKGAFSRVLSCASRVFCGKHDFTVGENHD